VAGRLPVTNFFYLLFLTWLLCTATPPLPLQLVSICDGSLVVSCTWDLFSGILLSFHEGWDTSTFASPAPLLLPVAPVLTSYDIPGISSANFRIILGEAPSSLTHLPRPGWGIGYSQGSLRPLF
jgi:hypothetical protein